MLNELAAQLHQEARQKGFWEGENNPAEKLMLIVSELAEAMEDLRDGRRVNEALTRWHSTPYSTSMPDITMTRVGSFFYYGTLHQREVTDKDYENAGWLAKPVGFPSEMADVLIRTLESCAAWGIDIDEAIALKRAYNSKRGHMNGGKKF